MLPRARISVSPEHPSFHANTQPSLEQGAEGRSPEPGYAGQSWGRGGMKPPMLSWEQPLSCSECQRVVRRCWAQAEAGEEGPVQPPHTEGLEQGVPGGAEGSGQPHAPLSALCPSRKCKQRAAGCPWGHSSSRGVPAVPGPLALVFPPRGIPIAASLLLASSCSSGTAPGCSEVSGQGHDSTQCLGALWCFGTLDSSWCARDGPFCLSGCSWV